MKTITLLLTSLLLLTIGATMACTTTSAKSADVSDSIRKSLDQAGLKDVSVSQDRDKGIVTLGGQVASENDKAQAESLAKSFAGAQVVADQIAVIPVGGERAAKEVNSEDTRSRAANVASGVPNVQQVVNDLQVKNQKASSSQ